MEAAITFAIARSMVASVKGEKEAWQKWPREQVEVEVRCLNHINNRDATIGQCAPILGAATRHGNRGCAIDQCEIGNSLGPFSPPLGLAATSKACYRLRSSLSPPELAVASRAYCRLESLLPPPELTIASRACYRLQIFPIPPKLGEPDPTPASLCHPTERLTRPTCKARSEPRPKMARSRIRFDGTRLDDIRLDGTTENPP